MEDLEQDVRADADEAIALVGQVLSTLFLADPADAALGPLLEQFREAASLDDWPFGSRAELEHAGSLLKEGAASGPIPLSREYQRLFIGPHHFEAPAWGSVYLDSDQVLFGTSTQELQQWMGQNGIFVNDGKREPVDHMGKMLALLGWLAREKPTLVAEFLSMHLMPWAPRYLELLRVSAKNPFYEGLAVLASATLDGIIDELGVEPVKKQLYR